MKNDHKLMIIKKYFEKAFLEVSNIAVRIIQGFPFWGPPTTLVMIFYAYWQRENHPLMNAFSWWFDITLIGFYLYLLTLNALFIFTFYTSVKFYLSSENYDDVNEMPFHIESKPWQKVLAFVLGICFIVLSYEFWQFWMTVYKFWITKRGFLQGVGNFMKFN